MSAFDDFIRAVEQATGRDGRRTGRNVRLLCPAHDDHVPSLDVAEGSDGRPLVVCRSHGCSYEQICAAISWQPQEFASDRESGEWTPAGSATAVYDYVDAHGVLLYQVCRTANKQFPQRRPDPSRKGGWAWKLGDVRRVIYRLPDVIAAVASGETVYLCEGEKDVESLRRLGVSASCNPGGAGKWRDEFAEALVGANVVVVADRDGPGRKHAARVAASLELVAESVSVVEPAEGKDVSDHLAAGHELQELVPVHLSGNQEEGADARPFESDDIAMGAELFHTSGYEPFATFPVGEHRETWPLRSRRFKIWFSGRLYEARGKVPTSSARNDLQTLLESIAIHGSPLRDVHLRVAGDAGAIHIDLGNDAWEVVEITAGGWRVIHESPLKFRRTSGTQPLPAPVKGGSIDDLRPFVNVDEDGWILYVSWLVACFRPHGPYPVLDLLGEQGSAKSTAAHVARDLVDPSRAPLRTAPRDARDFVVTTTNSWVTALDNLSTIADWLSDALCRLSTGGGFVTRELYTDAEEVIFDAQRPVILTGITELATRSDLLDRALLITLPRIDDEARLPENVFWERFEQAKPRILGALLDAVSLALREQDAVRIERLPRMADFAVWSAAAAPELGWSAGDFLAAYERNRASVHEVALGDSLVGQALLDVGRKGFEGTATDLLQKLASAAGDTAAKERGWPRNAQALSNHIRRLAPNLRALGVDVTFARESTGQKRRLVTLAPRSAPVTPVTAATPPADAETPGDEPSVSPATPSPEPMPLHDSLGQRGGTGDESDASVQRPATEEEEAMIERLLERYPELAGE